MKLVLVSFFIMMIVVADAKTLDQLENAKTGATFGADTIKVKSPPKTCHGKPGE